MNRTAKSLSGFLLVLLMAICTSDSAHGQSTGKPSWQQLAGVTKEEISDRQDIQRKAGLLLVDRRFEGLESLATRYRNSKEAFSDGEWKLSVFYNSMTYYLSTASEAMWTNRIENLRRWVREKPKSVTAHVALAECIVGYAFAGRSYGWAKDVSEEQWRLFRERMDEATRVLMEVKDISPSCPGWLAAFQRIASSSGWPPQAYEKLFKEAIASEPTYNMYYFRKAWHLMPRWSGKPGEWEEFATASANKTGGVAGDVLYARIVWFLDRYGPYDNMTQKPKSIDWDRVCRGLKAIKADNDKNVR
jgi:hypothetical protein